MMKLFKQDFSRQDILYLAKTGIEVLVIAAGIFLFMWLGALLDYAAGV